MEASKKEIKVDAYDFFGYLVPGVILLFSVVFFHVDYFRKESASLFFQGVIGVVGGASVSQVIIATVFVVLVGYVLGHVISSVSSLFFEKFIVQSIFGYPFMSIVFSERRSTTHRANVFKVFVTLIYFSFVLYVVCPRDTFFFFSVKSVVLYPYLYSFAFALCMLALYFEFDFTKRCAKGMSFVFLGVEKVVKFFSGTDRVLPQSVKDKISRKYKQRFDLDLSARLGSEVFWSMYWYVTQRDSYLRAKIDKWLILYSFMRNLSCACLLSSLVIVLPQVVGGARNSYATVHALVLLFFSIVFAIRYFYLYYSYYSKGVCRAFAYVDFEAKEDCSSKSSASSRREED